MLTISNVDSESFRRLVEKIPTKSGVKLPQRKSFDACLEKEYNTINTNLRVHLEMQSLFPPLLISGQSIIKVSGGNRAPDKFDFTPQQSRSSM